MLDFIYLTYGWWLQNPNSIATYPESQRVDPLGKTAQWYFQEAYNIALEGINNAGSTYQLQGTYYDVNVGSNDRNKEMLLFADHTENSEFGIYWSRFREKYHRIFVCYNSIGTFRSG